MGEENGPKFTEVSLFKVWKNVCETEFNHARRYNDKFGFLVRSIPDFLNEDDLAKVIDKNRPKVEDIVPKKDQKEKMGRIGELIQATPR